MNSNIHLPGCLCGHFEWCDICRPDSKTTIMDKRKLKSMISLIEIRKYIDCRINQLKESIPRYENNADRTINAIIGELEMMKRFLINCEHNNG